MDREILRQGQDDLETQVEVTLVKLAAQWSKAALGLTKDGRDAQSVSIEAKPHDA